jgi:hypothetical protein
MTAKQDIRSCETADGMAIAYSGVEIRFYSIAGQRRRMSRENTVQQPLTEILSWLMPSFY